MEQNTQQTGFNRTLVELKYGWVLLGCIMLLF